MSLNRLVEAQPCFSNEDLKKISSTTVLLYNTDQPVLDMAREMYELRDSNLILKSWMKRTNTLVFEIGVSNQVPWFLCEIIDEFWDILVEDFCQLGLKIAKGCVTFEEVDEAVCGCGDWDDGIHIKCELKLMVKMIGNDDSLDKNWPNVRFNQIKEYRQLHNAAESANAILRIRDRLDLQGDFSHIKSLTQLVRYVQKVVNIVV